MTHCAGHPELPDEFRTLVLTLIDRIDPVLDQVRGATADAEPGDPCASCPVCAVLAAVRGERSELAVRLAEYATGMLAVLRAALAEGDPEPAAPGAEPPPPPGRTVQHIPVVRVAR